MPRKPLHTEKLPHRNIPEKVKNLDAVEFIREYRRMEKATKCEISILSEANAPSNVVAEVEKWAKEHPIKTRQSELQKLFPDLALENGWFCMCPKYVGQKKCIDGPLEKSTCDKCRRDFYMKEIE